MKTRLSSRPATAKDVEAFFGHGTPYTIKARALEIDGEVVGLAGYRIAGPVAVVFSDMKASIPKMTIWREAKAIMQGLKIPAICFAEEGSGPFLERLGWSYVGPAEDGDMYKWQPSF